MGLMQSPTADNNPIPPRYPNPAAAERVNRRSGPHPAHHDPATAAGSAGQARGPTAGRAGAAGADPPADQPHHRKPWPPCLAPANRRSTGSFTTWARFWPAHRAPTRQPRRAADHRRHPHPGTRPDDHRAIQQLLAQHQRANPHQFPPPHRHHYRPLAARQPQRRHRRPRHRYAPVTGNQAVLGDGGYRGIKTITTPHLTGLATRSAITTDVSTGASEPVLNMSSPDSKTGNSYINALAAATPPTTAPRSRPDSGTSRPTPDYGSFLSRLSSGA
jgi:hypothetical protein